MGSMVVLAVALDLTQLERLTLVAQEHLGKDLLEAAQTKLRQPDTLLVVGEVLPQLEETNQLQLLVLAGLVF
jgi:hypothetical protein